MILKELSLLGVLILILVLDELPPSEFFNRCIVEETETVLAAKEMFRHFKAQISPIRKPVNSEKRTPNLHGSGSLRRY